MPTATAAPAGVAAWAEAKYTCLADVAAAIGVAVGAHRADVTWSAPLTEADLRRLDLGRVVVPALKDHADVGGLGVVWDPVYVDPPEWRIVWWDRYSHRGAIARSFFDLRPGSVTRYEYERLPWFAEVLATGGPVFCGPYLDYLGANRYIATLGVPLAVGGVTLGVVGCDVQMDTLERSLLPVLGGRSLVNASGRVVVSANAALLPGELAPADAAADPLGWAGLALV